MFGHFIVSFSLLKVDEKRFPILIVRVREVTSAAHTFIYAIISHSCMFLLLLVFTLLKVIGKRFPIASTILVRWSEDEVSWSAFGATY